MEISSLFRPVGQGSTFLAPLAYEEDVHANTSVCCPLLLPQLIIRSHEGPDAREKRSGLGGMDEGYTIDHVVESGKLITLFSAPDYPQFQVFLFPFCNIAGLSCGCSSSCICTLML